MFHQASCLPLYFLHFNGSTNLRAAKVGWVISFIICNTENLRRRASRWTLNLLKSHPSCFTVSNNRPFRSAKKDYRDAFYKIKYYLHVFLFLFYERTILDFEYYPHNFPIMLSASMVGASLGPTSMYTTRQGSSSPGS